MAQPNWPNRTLFICDNIDVLENMNSGTVDLIATDPPFNKGRDFHSTPDKLQGKQVGFKDRWRWDEDTHEEWHDKLHDDWPSAWRIITLAREAYGDDMGAFLCFMGVRLMEMHRILKDTGSIYLHCDPTASHYLKALMDSIFGKKNFQNEIIWSYKSGGASKKRFSKKHDILLFYSKSGNFLFNPQQEKSYNRDFKPYRFKGVQEYEDNIGWYTLVNMRDVWEIDMVGRTSKERTGYPTQKPLTLYSRIIEASCPPEGIVLDPFAGCATTLVAAEKLKRNWVGIDIWDDSYRMVVERLQYEGLLKVEGEVTIGSLEISLGDVYTETQPPVRTDTGEAAAPTLRLKTVITPPSDRLTNAKRKELLIQNNGLFCSGCGREFAFPEDLELDHITPRSDGGSNNIENRTLLCSMCNRLKSNKLTLSGLRKRLKELGYLN